MDNTQRVIFLPTKFYGKPKAIEELEAVRRFFRNYTLLYRLLEIAGITIKRGRALLGEIKVLQDVLKFFCLAA